MADPVWYLNSAVNLIQILQPRAFEVNFYLALAGGNLNRGYSYNDLDLVAVNNQPESNYRELKAVLDKALNEVSTVKIINYRAHLKWPGLKVECLVIEALPRYEL